MSPPAGGRERREEGSPVTENFCFLTLNIPKPGKMQQQDKSHVHIQAGD